MPVKHVEEYRDRRVAQRLIAEMHALSRRPVRLMEVCGTHTMAIFRSGLRALLP
ncbi:MAG: hydrogenase formation protein HypD, partial [Desulfobacteraceae bacterium]